MFRRTIGYAAVLAAGVTIGQASSADALIVAPPSIMYLGVVNGCQVTLTNAHTAIVTNADGTKTPQTVGTCSVVGGGIPCPAEAPWPQIASSCANPANVSDVCNNGACTWGVPGIPEVGPCLDTTC
jgi:hypothetical protein